jgi:Trk K+ transport system NAD-binding subunit
MWIAVLGTGTVGRSLTGQLAGLGHDVVGTPEFNFTMVRAATAS